MTSLARDTLHYAKTTSSEKVTPLQRAIVALRQARQRIEKLEQRGKDPIAVIGVGCRLPGGVRSPADFWQLLRGGVDAIGEIPKERWSLDDWYDSDREAPGKMYTREGGFLSNLADFDAHFFNLSRHEVRGMDPQHRLLLEASWEALERAGVSAQSLMESQTGIFWGLSSTDYAQQMMQRQDFDAFFLVGNPPNAAAGRLSHTLGLQGPSMVVDTACSSSLVAVHNACQSLRTGECDLALAGGVNVILAPQGYVILSKAGMLAPDGRCKTLDARADGYGRGEGCGVVALKRLADAERDGDPILAVVLGSAVTHDGPSSGFTVPNGASQQAVIEKAQSMAGVSPEEIDYCELHGTGTPLGDPIEVRALGAVMENASRRHPLLIGGVKSNIGHLEAAAGAAGLIKTVLALKHGEVPPTLHVENPNPDIPWDNLPIEPTRALRPWPENGERRLAGVSAFGASGTNVHLVLSGPPSIPKPESLQPTINPTSSVAERQELFVLSAQSEDALRDLATRHAEHLDRHPELDLADVAYTAAAGRAHHPYRLATLVSSREDLIARLTAFVAGREGVVQTARVRGRRQPSVAFILGNGLGDGFGEERLPRHEMVQEALDRCSEAASGHLRRPLFADREADSPWVDPAEQALANAAERYALARFWQAWGVEPALVLSQTEDPMCQVIEGRLELADAFGQIAVTARQRLEPAAASLSVPKDIGVVLVLGRKSRVPGFEGTWLETGTSYLGTIADLYLAGLRLDWEQSRQESTKVELPTYPFQREYLWLDDLVTPTPSAPVAEKPESSTAHEARSETTPVVPEPAVSEPAVSEPAVPAPVAPAPTAQVPVAPTLASIQNPIASPVAAASPTPGAPVPRQAGLPQLFNLQLQAAQSAVAQIIDQQMVYLRNRQVPATSAPVAAPSVPAVAAATPPSEPAIKAVEEATEEEPAWPEPVPATGEWTLLLAAGESEATRDAALSRLAERLEEAAEPLETLARESVEQVIPAPFRGAVIGRSTEEAVDALRETAAKKRRLILGRAVRDRSVAFLFPGLGDHYVGMGEGLYQSEPVYRAAFDQCANFLEPRLGTDLRGVVFAPRSKEPAETSGKMSMAKLLGRGKKKDPATERLNQMAFTHLAIFSTEYALAKLWMSRGVRPEAMIGYSIGEYVAACLAGVFTLEEALHLLHKRAELIEALAPGSMLAVPLSASELSRFLDEDLFLAAESTPELSVVSGTPESIARLQTRLLEEADILSRPLQSTRAFHSPLLDPMLGEFEQAVRTVDLASPQVPFLSTVTGTWITAEEATDAGYWVRHTREPVRFATALTHLFDQPSRVLLEVGPGQSLCSFAHQHAASERAPDRLMVPSLRASSDPRADEEVLLCALGQLWVGGLEFDWRGRNPQTQDIEAAEAARLQYV